MWSYLIKGFFPEFGSPKVRSKIDTKWTKGAKIKLN